MNHDKRSSFIQFGILVLILGLALFLRQHYFFGVMRGDDFSYAQYAYELYRGTLNTDVNLSGISRVGLYGPTALAYALFGVSEASAVLFPLLSSMLTILFIYGITSMLAGAPAATAAAFLWAVFQLDVFMATQLDPESPLVMATTGAAWACLSALRAKKPAQKVLLFALVGLFIVWALRIKPSATPIIGVIFLFLLDHYWAAVRETLIRVWHWTKARTIFSAATVLVILVVVGMLIAHQPWPLTWNNLELTAYDIAPAWVLGRVTPVQRSDVGGGYWVVDREPFTPQPRDNMLTEPGEGSRLKVLDAFVPLFIVAAAVVVVRKKERMYLPLTWFAFLFVYLEWGSFPRSFKPDNLAIYSPVTHWVSANNFMYVCVPMVVVLGWYLAKELKENHLRIAILLAVTMTAGFAIWLGDVNANLLALKYIQFASLAAILLAIASPFVTSLAGGITRNRSLMFGCLLVLLGAASLLPSQHYHLFDFSKESARRSNLMAAVAFLGGQPELPIHSSGQATRLDFYAGFSYGYVLIDDGYDYPEIRMTDDVDLIERVGGYFVGSGCGQPIGVLGDWPLAEFGDSIDPHCVSIRQYLPPERAASDLDTVAQKALGEPSVDTINTYLSVAANAENTGAFIEALALMATNFPTQTPIVQASGLLSAKAEDDSPRQSIDLLKTVEDQVADWSFGDKLLYDFTELGDGQALVVQIDGHTENVETIVCQLALESGTAYVLQISLRSFAPFDLVRFPEEEIPDSYPDGWGRLAEWADMSIVFVTPLWPESERDVMFEIARVYDRGDLWIRDLRLIEVGGLD